MDSLFGGVGLGTAEAEIKNGSDAKIVRMAKKIIVSQSKEIAAFDKCLAAHSADANATIPEGN